MVDTAVVGTVTKIIEVALMIKDAVDTVKHNKEVCIDTKTRMTRLSAILQKLNETDAMKDPAMSATLLGLEETLRRALSIVKACQKKRFFCHLFRANDLSKELSQANQDIFTHMTEVILATNVQMTMMITTRFQDGVTGANPKSKVLSKAQSMQGEQEGRLVDSHPVWPKTNGEGKVECSHSSHSTDHTRSEVERKKDGLGFTIFTLTELKAATEDFSEEHLTGNGGFAKVYKGVLPDGLVVAIKKFDQIASSEEKQHVVHYITLFSVLLQHKNVVRLLGYCQEVRIEIVAYEGKLVPAQHGVIVEEYITNGTLAELIRGQSSQQVDWSKRFKIVLGVAHGAAYLHSRNIIHLDLKPENVLLDSDMTPKICDFELSRILDEGGESTTDIVGTLHYMPPEYINGGFISMKNDVYSFGIILLQTINGMMSPSSRDSIDWLRNALEGQDADWVIDPLWCDEEALNKVKRYRDIGLLCTATERNDRPTMAEVVKMLEGNEQLPTLKRRNYSSRSRPKPRSMPDPTRGSIIKSIITDLI